jgi:hypothetical protein
VDVESTMRSCRVSEVTCKLYVVAATMNLTTSSDNFVAGEGRVVRKGGGRGVPTGAKSLSFTEDLDEAGKVRGKWHQ